MNNVSTIQKRIADMAKKYPDRGITSLNRYLTEEWLEAAFRRVRKDAASGIDGIKAKDYEETLDTRLPELVTLAKTGEYYAPPVRRTYIEKPGKKEKRPLGIPTVEDKTLQRAVVMLIEPIYENEFYDFSYGFRPGRSAHDAVRTLHNDIMDMGSGWILDVDIRRFFDTINHEHLREFLRLRVRDGVLNRLIHKWLKAGVMEAGQRMRNKEGTPQGGVVSPLLANIYLHEVLDKWFAEQIKPRMTKRCFLVRYCDDFVMGFESKRDAERVLAVLAKRFGKYGLEIHPEKTRMVDFRRPQLKGRLKNFRSGTFDFLGFTHYWGKSREGFYTLKHKTASDRLKRALCSINRWCRDNRHQPVPLQRDKLNQKLRGHFQYYGVSTNSHSLNVFADKVIRYWFKWLNRRQRRRDGLSWPAYIDMLKQFRLTRPYIAHRFF